MARSLREIIDLYETTGSMGLYSSVSAEEDALIISQIECRGRELLDQLNALEVRWEKRVDMLSKRRGVDIRRDYDFRDAIA